jgi:hypothetical protein
VPCSDFPLAKMMCTRIPYVYSISWTSKNLHYVGVQYGLNANPTNLWKTYFSSSKQVKIIREKYGDPDIIKIRKIFNDPEKARKHEHALIKRAKLVENENYLNLSNNTGKWFVEGSKGRKFSDEHRAKLRAAKLGRKISADHAKALHDGRRGQTNTAEHNDAIRKSNRDRIVSDESKVKMKESRAKISSDKLKEICSKGGLTASKLRPSNYSEIQSERMKLWWSKRKENL